MIICEWLKAVFTSTSDHISQLQHTTLRLASRTHTDLTQRDYVLRITTRNPHLSEIHNVERNNV